MKVNEQVQQTLDELSMNDMKILILNLFTRVENLEKEMEVILAQDFVKTPVYKRTIMSKGVEVESEIIK